MIAWPAGAATGVGSWPGTDPAEAARTVAGELPDLPHLVELPGRGPGADMVGRAAAILSGLHVDLQPSGWRFVARPGLDERRAQDYLARDLDALEQALDGYAGPLKIQAAGPWTLAAGIELTRGDRSLGDPAAVRDIAVSLAEGLAAHRADVARRVPGATVLLQLDEPSLPAVSAGRIPTASGFGALRAVDQPELADILRIAVADDTGVHCCAADVPLDLLGRIGLAFVSVDATLLPHRAYDSLAGLVEKDVHLLLGIGDDAGVARRLWRDLGYPDETLAAHVVLTPTCGLAGSSPDEARQTVRTLREQAKRLREPA